MAKKSDSPKTETQEVAAPDTLADQGAPSPLDLSPSREEFDTLKARVDALAAHHLQTYGKAF